MHSSGNAVRLRTSARTSTGQVRENNEDNIHLWTQEDSALAIVADGMGGAAAGEEASRLAVEAIEEGLVQSEAPVLQNFVELGDETVAQKLRDIIQSANNEIMERAAAEPELRGMGTTVTLAFVRDMHAIVAHVGDSRAYLVSKRDRKITQITADHSFVEALVTAGHITQEQAEDHPMRNVLYRALGQTEDIDVDVYHTRLRNGDRLILCSDGLTRHVKSYEIAEIALESDEPDEISQHLIDLTNERGGEDNVSVAVVLIEITEGAAALNREGMRTLLLEDDTLVLKEPLSNFINLDVRDTGTEEEVPADSYVPAEDTEDTIRGGGGWVLSDDHPAPTGTQEREQISLDEEDPDDTIPDRAEFDARMRDQPPPSEDEK